MLLDADADPVLWTRVDPRNTKEQKDLYKTTAKLLTTRPSSSFRDGDTPENVTAAWASTQGWQFRQVGLTIGRTKPQSLAEAWSWRMEPTLLACVAAITEFGSSMRSVRSGLPIGRPDAEDFPGLLGAGKKCVSLRPADPKALPFAIYQWDLSTHVVTVTALCRDVNRFTGLIPFMDDLARRVHLTDEMFGARNIFRFDEH